MSRQAETPAQRHERELAELAQMISGDARDVARLGRSPLNGGAVRQALSGRCACTWTCSPAKCGENPRP